MSTSCPWVSCLLCPLLGQAGTQAPRRLGGLESCLSFTEERMPLFHVERGISGQCHRHVGLQQCLGRHPRGTPGGGTVPAQWESTSLGRLGFTNSPGSIPRVLGKGCSYEVFTGLGKRGERGLNCGSDGLQLPTALVSCPALSQPQPHGGAWCLGLP